MTNPTPEERAWEIVQRVETSSETYLVGEYEPWVEALATAIRDAVAAARAEEREACAQIADESTRECAASAMRYSQMPKRTHGDEIEWRHSYGGMTESRRIARAIRARGENDETP